MDSHLWFNDPISEEFQIKWKKKLIFKDNDGFEIHKTRTKCIQSILLCFVFQHVLINDEQFPMNYLFFVHLVFRFEFDGVEPANQIKRGPYLPLPPFRAILEHATWNKRNNDTHTH